MVPKVGDKVKLYTWTGVVTDIFISPTSGKIVVHFYLVKNAFKAQYQGESHEYEPDQMDAIQPATEDEIMAEIQETFEIVAKELKEKIGVKDVAIQEEEEG